MAANVKQELAQNVSEVDTSQQEEEVPLMVVRVKDSCPSPATPRVGVRLGTDILGEDTHAVEKSAAQMTTRRGSARKTAVSSDSASSCPKEESSPREISAEGAAGGESAASGLPSKESSTSAVRKGTRKRAAPASPDLPSSGSPTGAESSGEKTVAKEESGSMETELETSPNRESPAKSARSPRESFVPHYEPIQTRKRAKTPRDVAPLCRPGHAAPGGPRRKDAVQKAPRPRMSKDEVLTPDLGPRPKAVPKSLLILEPELLPRSVKKRQGRLASTIQIHTSATVSKYAPAPWPQASQSDVAVVSSAVSEEMKAPASLPLELSSALLLAAAESEHLGQVKRTLKVTQGEDGTTSYILTAVADEDGSGGLVGDGPVTAVELLTGVEEGDVATVTVISEPEPGDGKSDTPTSLLLLAEAAYPTTAGPATQAASVTASATQAPLRILTSATDGRHPPKTGVQAKAGAASPAVVTVSSM